MNKLFNILKARVHVVLIVVVLIAAVSLMNRYSLNLDLTKGKVFTLSEVSRTLVRDLKDPLRVKVFISKNLPPPLNDLQLALEDLLAEYAENATGGNFSYNFYDVTESEAESNPKIEANIKLANDYGIYGSQVQTLEKDQMQVIKVYSGIVIEYGNLIERIAFLTDTAKLEFQITTILDKMNKKLNRLVSLDEPIQAKLYLNDTFIQLAPLFQIQGLDGFSAGMIEVFEKVSQENYGRVEFEVVSTISSEEQQLLSTQGVNFYPWNEFKSPDGKTIPAGSGVATLVISYQDRREVIEILTPQSSLQVRANTVEQVVRYVPLNLSGYDSTVNGIIDNLLDINDFIAYLSDKDTLSLQRAPQNQLFQQPNAGGEGANFYGLLSENYTVEEVGIEGLSTKYKTLVIAGAKEKFSDYDLFLIDQYLMQGRSLLIFQDVLENKLPPEAAGRAMPEWGQVDNGLDALLEHYGIEVKPTYVMDKNSYVSRGQGQNGGITEQKIFFAPIIQDQFINHDFMPLQNFKTFIALEASPVETIEENINNQGVVATRLFSSGNESWLQGDNVSLIPSLIQPPSAEAEFKSSDLGYILEGEFKSYFAGKDIPAKPVSEEDAPTSGEAPKKVVTKENLFNIKDSDTIIEQGKPAKVIVIGSSSMIKNNLIDPNGEGENAKLALNLVDYLSDRGDWTLMRTKAQRLIPLEPYDADAGGLTAIITNREVLKWFNMMFLPVLVGVVGLLVYASKISRKKRLAELFKIPN